MSSYSMGFYYDYPKRGEGVSLEWPRGSISCLTKVSALKVKRELIDLGYNKDSIIIEKN